MKSIRNKYSRETRLKIMENIRITLICCTTSVLALGCASKPEDIIAVAYPDEAYAGLSCEQIGRERIRVQDQVLAATGHQRSKRKKDQAWGWTGAILFAPALFMMDGNEETATRLAVLKGQYESMERVSAAKRCVGNIAQ
jgi:hypothetical protein